MMPMKRMTTSAMTKPEAASSRARPNIRSRRAARPVGRTAPIATRSLADIASRPHPIGYDHMSKPGGERMVEIGLFEAIRSARAMRRLKADPVPEALIARVMDAAIRAPSAGNAQNWAFVVVRDAEQRRRVGALYRKASDIAEAMYQARSHPAHLTEAQ